MLTASLRPVCVSSSGAAAILGFAGECVKNLVFCGDGVLCPQDGYGDLLVELLTLRRPAASFHSFVRGEAELTTEGALRDAPALIGKAPDFVLLGVGHADILRGDEPALALARLRDLVQLLLIKTHADVAVASLCTAFLPAEAREAATAFNADLPDLVDRTSTAGARVRVADLDAPVRAFLEAHRRGGGEKRALHVQSLRPTSMGRLLLAHAAWDALGLESFFPA